MTYFRYHQLCPGVWTMTDTWQIISNSFLSQYINKFYPIALVWINKYFIFTFCVLIKRCILMIQGLEVFEMVQGALSHSHLPSSLIYLHFPCVYVCILCSYMWLNSVEVYVCMCAHGWVKTQGWNWDSSLITFHTIVFNTSFTTYGDTHDIAILAFCCPCGGRETYEVISLMDHAFLLNPDYRDFWPVSLI